ncbi:XRE family transcriptional regulator [bacterium]|jgi:transcriptional regulator with XRE-family HTH domain|nr:XRE family transcriptional regulator [bacterium]NBW56309.1 XRE family transcriptional regulator [bacterium]NBX72474.1 XRE family transcriptional regulator [bacterium]
MKKKELIEDLGRIINKIRKKKPMSQVILGNLSESSQMTIQRIESGNGGGTKIETLLGIAEALEVSLADIFFELEKESIEGKEFNSNWEKAEHVLKSMNPSEKEWISEIILKILDHKQTS